MTLLTFEKYQHVERFGTPGVHGIECGTCHVFPKIDGTNASVWYSERVRAGSRNRELSLESDNHGFCAHVQSDDRIQCFFAKYPHLYLYGEWLVPHSLKTYREDAWRKFYVFDVMIEGQVYVPYEQYKEYLEEFELDYIPCYSTIVNGTEEQFRKQLEVNDFLMKDGEVGEGIVIKNYEYQNKFGRTNWAKMVTSEFKEKNFKAMTAPVKEGKTGPERWIAETYVTRALIDKELAKFEPDFQGPVQPRLLSTIFHCIIEEETKNFVKKLKNPTVNFRELQKWVNYQVKTLAPEYF